LEIEAQMPATLSADFFVTKLLDLSAPWIENKREQLRARRLQKW